MIDYLMRSLMFVPAHKEKLLGKAIQSEADVLLLDLEDSVQPSGNKAIARKNIKDLASKGKLQSRKVFPRVNDRESGHLLKDVYELSVPGIDGFMYPKAKSGQDIYFISKLLETIEYEKGLPVGTFKLIPLIETASAVLHAEEIANASERVIAIAYGCEDYIADLEGIHDEDDLSLYVPRSLIAMAARSAGKIPIDTVHVDVHDMEDLEENLKLAKKLGYEGMLVLNPKEISLVHEYFTPSEEEVKNARKILELAEDAEKEGSGVVIKDGEFVGPPMIRKAKKVLAKVKKR